jgi:hypothetical protein
MRRNPPGESESEPQSHPKKRDNLAYAVSPMHHAITVPQRANSAEKPISSAQRKRCRGTFEQPSVPDVSRRRVERLMPKRRFFDR